MQGNEIRIGDLRWKVTIANRTHVADDDPSVVDLQTVYTNQRSAYADIRPVGTQGYLLGQQLEIGAITHRITVRWSHTLTNQDVVLRTQVLPDGTTRQEVYRIHRMGQWQGRNRFLILDVELETQSV